MKKIQAILLLLGVVLLIGACATTKNSKKKPKGLKKVYENITAHYNGYFNAKVKVDESFRKLNEQHQDNYNKILDLYKYSAVDNVKAVSNELDEASKKASIAISLHRHSRWTDDCYMLIGQSHYLKQDYGEAEKTFKYIMVEFDPERAKTKEELKKEREKKKKAEKKAKEDAKKAKLAAIEKRRKDSRKKKKGKKVKTDKTKEAVTASIEEKVDGKPRKYVMKHQPAREDGMIWLARTYIEQGKYDEAQIIMTRLGQDKTLPKDLRADLGAVEAYYFLTQKKYEKAIEPLTNAVALSRRKREKSRYMYIIAQIHQAAKRNKEAYASFEQVLKFNPRYEMEFSTKLNMAKNGWVSGQETAEEIEKKLLKMAKDIKNEEFLDQVYFALGDIAIKNKEQDKAVEYLKKSLANNSKNKTQKAESYLLLADIYFEKESYVNAKKYYDSTLTVLSNVDERYDRASRYASNLTDIAKNIEIIELQDSLLKVGRMSDADKQAWAKKVKEEEAKKIVSKPPKPTLKPRPLTGRPGSESTWVFYDQSKVKKGKRDFKKKWGERQLTDDWRRSSRQGASNDNSNPEEGVPDVGSLDEEELSSIFKRIGVPQDEKAIKASEDKIIAAMSALGTQYRDRIDNTKKSIEILEELNRRFPGNKYEAQSLYTLYIMYQDIGQQAKAQACKKKILDSHAKSTFANAIKNPDFLKNKEKETKQLVSYYDNAYTLYENDNAKEALEKVNNVDKQFGKNNTMKPKFALLKAMCMGSIDGLDAYRLGLKEVIAKYPNTEEKEKAAEILSYLNGGKPSASKPTKPKPNASTDGSVFNPNLQGTHYIVVLFTDKNENMADVKAAASDYNKENYRLQKLRVSSLLMDIDKPILTIRRFRSKEEAMKYYKGIAGKPDDFLADPAIGYKAYVVTQKNYKVLLTKKNIAAYDDFFQKNYLND